GKPFLDDAKYLFQSALSAAAGDIERRLAEIRLAIDAGKVETAVGQYSSMRELRILSLNDATRRAFAEMESEMTVLQQKLEADKRAAAEAAQRSERWRTQTVTTLAEGKRLEGEGKYAEAVLEYRKAMLYSGGGVSGKQAAEGITALEATMKKAQSSALSTLNSARQWTVGKQYPKAVEKCGEIIAAPALAGLHEEFLSLIRALEELEKNPADAKAVMKRFDDMQKTINGWVEEQMSVPIDLRCASCGGAGVRSCKACSGAGQTEPAACAVCLGSGKMPDPVCSGTGKVECPTCKGKGEVEEWEDKIETCKVCNGTGWDERYVQKKKCKTCGGKGKSSTRVNLGLVRCKACDGNKQTVCRACTSGLVLCTNCNGRGKTPTTCAACKGSGTVPCVDCGSSGLAPEKY
ncbi:MAG: hypothetical protein RDV41_08250, partial [Planctomycetota bacterium]|nr:hypothetical protein [Planctomycetota bacterium]